MDNDKTLATTQDELAKKNPKKRKLWIIVSAVVGLTVLIAGVFLLVYIFDRPGKADYQAALDKFDGSFQDILDESEESELKVSDDLKKVVEDRLAKTDEQIRGMRSMKALKDGELREAFDKYVDEFNRSKETIREHAIISHGLLVYSQDCASRIATFDITGKSPSQIESEFDEKAAKCRVTIEELKKSEDKTLVGMARDYEKYIFQDLRNFYIKSAEAIEAGRFKPLDYPEMPKENSAVKEVTDKMSEYKTIEYQQSFYDLLKKKAEQPEA